MSKKILLGKEKFYGKGVTLDVENIKTNGHILILGESGTGKTYLTQILLEEIAENGLTSYILDLSGSLSLSQCEPPFLAKVSEKMEYRNVARQGTGMDLFQKIMLNEETDENDIEVSQRLADTLSSYFGKGENQKALLYKYIKLMVSKVAELNTTARLELLMELLKQAEEETAKIMAKRMAVLVDGRYFSRDSMEKDGIDYKIKIWQMQTLSVTIKQMISELILWQLWGRAVAEGDKNRPIYILIDECQNLKLTLNSPIYKILCEGRKYGINLILCTQFYKGKFQPEVEMAVAQIGNKIFLKPPDREIKLIAGMIVEDEKRKKMENNLRNLKRGEAIVSGGFFVGPDSESFIKRPKQIEIRKL